MRRAVLLATAALAAALAAASVGAGAASAYGRSAVHQVEISASIAPNLFGHGTGGGIWLWIELDGTSATSGGTGDYTGSDCLHHTPIASFTGAVSDRGDVTWTSDGTSITISGVVIGGDTPLTITVPLAGHVNTNLASVFSPPVGGLPGRAEVTVAP
jgi:hypothetical protein